MDIKNLIELLNQNNNFHLSLRCIMANEVKVLDALKNRLENNNNNTLVIDSLDNAYNQLTYAYNNKIDYVLVNKDLSFMLPLVNIITTDDISTIKPMIPTFYCLKDNRIIQKVKTTCNKKMSTYKAFHSIEELLEEVLNTL